MLPFRLFSLHFTPWFVSSFCPGCLSLMAKAGTYTLTIPSSSLFHLSYVKVLPRLLNPQWCLGLGLCEGGQSRAAHCSFPPMFAALVFWNKLYGVLTYAEDALGKVSDHSDSVSSSPAFFTLYREAPVLDMKTSGHDKSTPLCHLSSD